MIELQRISYCRLGTTDLEGAEAWATKILGLDVAERTKDALYFKSDERDHTLCYFFGRPDDQTAAFEVASPEELAAAAGELERIGHPVHDGTAEECELRKVRAFIGFDDPSGNHIELVLRPAHGGRYHGFRDAGITGFSHIGLFSTDIVRDEAFWTGVFNARVSDRVGDVPLLRIDEVHHSIAPVKRPTPGLHHINHQVASTDDVMRSHRLLVEHGIPIAFGPGRHPASSAKFVYFEGHDGLMFEYSVGVKLIGFDDEPLYRERDLPMVLESICEWGATPKGVTDIRD
jgi:2,3-dihydroxy-p-cumate/2,3-dihydroxybenzoate 3,4-dioxygenase